MIQNKTKASSHANLVATVSIFLTEKFLFKVIGMSHIVPDNVLIN